VQDGLFKGGGAFEMLGRAPTSGFSPLVRAHSSDNFGAAPGEDQSNCLRRQSLLSLQQCEAAVKTPKPVVEVLPEEEADEELERPGPFVEESLFKSNITHEIEDINKHPQTTKQYQQPVPINKKSQFFSQ
jgi:hypothetical protein